MTTEQVLKSNPWMTYGFAVGFVSGLAARKIGQQFSGLEANEWRNASDDYSQGYRHAFQS